MFSHLEALLYFGVKVIERDDQGAIEWMILEGSAGQRALVLGLTYRETCHALRDPTPEVIARTRKDAWEVWNDKTVWQDKEI